MSDVGRRSRRSSLRCLSYAKVVWWARVFGKKAAWRTSLSNLKLVTGNRKSSAVFHERSKSLKTVFPEY